MNYTEIYEFLRERLGPVQVSPSTNETVEQEEQPDIIPIHCGSFEDQRRNIFATHEDELKLEYAQEIKYTLATMQAVILSTTTTGGQLGLRVLGPPGSVKSTLSESLSCCRQLVYPCSKFTGIVSGGTSLRKSKNTAAMINGKCLLIQHDAPM